MTTPSAHANPLLQLHPLLRWSLTHPWWSLLVCVLITALAGYGLNQARVNNDPRAMFTEENEGLRLLEAVEAQFTREDNLIFIVVPANQNIFTPGNLTLLKRLTDAAWTLPRSQRVDSLINFQHTDVQGDELIVRNLVDNPGKLSVDEAARIREIALHEPHLVNNLVSRTGHVAAVQASLLADQQGGQHAKAIIDAANAIRADLAQAYPDVEIMISGMAAFHAASQLTTETELQTTSLYSSLAILLCLLVMLRHVAHVVVTMAVIGLSIVIAMGTVVWLGVDISPVMGGAPAIILTLAVADSIHLLITYQQQLTSGRSRQQALAESLRVNLQPVFLTSATTAAGFLFLNSSESPPFRDMANMVSIGVMVAFLLSIVLLPALIQILPQGRIVRRTQDGAWMTAFGDSIIAHRGPVLIASILIAVTMGFYSLKNQLNDVWLEYFDESYEIRQSTEFMLQELTGHHRLQFAFPSGTTNGIMEPGYMAQVNAFVDWARQQPEVSFVSGFSDVIKRLNRDMNGGDPAFYRIPEQRELIAQYTLMYQLSLPFGLGLENQINLDQSAVRVDVLLGHITANDILAFERRASDYIRANLPETMHTRGAGFDLLLGELSYQNGQGMLTGTALALCVVSLLLVFALRSLKYGLLSLLPNLLPATIAFGIWAWVDGFIGISVSIVACMTLGIVVDNTVHFLSKYLRARQEHQDTPVAATRYAFRTVGVALFANTVVIAGNFGIMATSHYYPNASMGLLTAITVAVALGVTYFFFVPLLLLVDDRKKQTPTLSNHRLITN